MYAVCKTPACQQTYLIKDLVEIIVPGYKTFCKNCNGVVTENDGMTQMSSLPDIRPVLGDNLLNALYKNGELVSIKLFMTPYSIIWWKQDQDLDEFIDHLKWYIKSPNMSRIILVQNTMDNGSINTGLVQKLIKSGIDVSRGKKKVLRCTKL